jgi:hypothetical protein
MRCEGPCCQLCFNGNLHFVPQHKVVGELEFEFARGEIDCGLRIAYTWESRVMVQCSTESRVNEGFNRRYGNGMN